MNAPYNVRQQKIGIVIIAMMALACALWLAREFSPGFMSFDTLYQYRQAIGLAALNDAHPVIMVMLWRFFSSISNNTGTMLHFHQLLYWFTISLFVLLVARRLRYRVALLLAIGFCPPLVITSLHIWKDVEMICALALACATLLGYIRHRHWAWLVVATLSLFYATAVRINGYVPALFLLFFLGYLCFGQLKLSRSKKAALIVIAVAGLSLGFFQAITVLNAKAEKSHVIGTLLVWDLAEISLAKNKDLIPPYIPRVSAGPVLEDLAKVRVREANYPFWSVVWPFPPEEHRRRLMPDWLSVVSANPLEYLKHRAHVLSVLMGIGVAEIYYPYHPGIDGNELGFKFNTISEQKAGSYFRGFELLAKTIFYRPWLYVLLCIAALCIACYRMRRLQGDPRENALAAAVALSGIANMASLFFLATAADFRYGIWTVFSALIASVIVLAGVLEARRESGNREPAQPGGERLPNSFDAMDGVR